MTVWDDRIESHPVTQRIRGLQAKVDDIAPPEDPDAMEIFERLRTVVHHLVWAIENSDAQLLTPSLVARIDGPSSNLQAQLDAYASNQERTYLDQANAYADQVLETLGAWPVHTGPLDAEGLRRSAESFRRSAGQLLRNIEGEAAEIQQQVADARASLDGQVLQLQQSLTELNNAVEAQAQQLQAQIPQHDAQFKTSQEQREQEFNQRRDELAADFQQALEAAKEEADRTMAELRDSVSSTVEDISRAKEKAEVLLDAIGRTGTEFGFKEYAEEEQKQANFWRWVAAGALLGIAAIGLVVLFLMDPQRANLGVSALRLLITVPLGALAAYAGRQSHHHRENERAARNLHLDIAAIDPYIALLPEDKRDEIKALMALRIFGHRYLFAVDVKAGTVGPAEGLVDTVVETMRRPPTGQE